MSQAPARILIVRLGAIGDVIMASGLLPALRTAYPDARIGWLTDELHSDLLAHNPKLDRLHTWPRRRWKEWRRAGHYQRLAQDMLRVVRELRAENYDWVLDLQGLLKSGVWAYAAGGKRRVGLGSREGSQLLMTEVISRRVEDVRIGSEYRRLLEYLNARPEAFTLDIPVSAANATHAAELLEQQHIIGPYVVIAPFTTRPQKHWFDERWVELAQRLHAERGWPVIMLGGPNDRERAAQIQALAGNGLLDFTGRTSLGLCAALIAQARLLIGVDTGLTHLGIAMKIPTLALFGSTRPYFDTCRPEARVLYHKLDCSPCRRHPTCGDRYDCMRLHVPESVLAAIDELPEPIR